MNYIHVDLEVIGRRDDLQFKRSQFGHLTSTSHASAKLAIASNTTRVADLNQHLARAREVSPAYMFQSAGTCMSSISHTHAK